MVEEIPSVLGCFGVSENSLSHRCLVGAGGWLRVFSIFLRLIDEIWVFPETGAQVSIPPHMVDRFTVFYTGTSR